MLKRYRTKPRRSIVRRMYLQWGIRKGLKSYDKCSAGLPDHGTDLKDKKHAHYLHDGNAIGFALDSMGEIPKLP
jgi:hypothetical protein